MITNTTWVDGPHHGLVWSRGAAMLDAEVDLGIARDLWERLGEEADVSQFLTQLLACTGHEVQSLPAFAVVVPTGTDAAHVTIRGGFTVRLDDGTSLTGSGLTTWMEQRLKAPGPLVISGPTHGVEEADSWDTADRLETGTTGVAREHRRPLMAGLVPCSELTLRADALSESSDAAAVQTDAPAMPADSEAVSARGSDPRPPQEAAAAPVSVTAAPVIAQPIVVGSGPDAPTEVMLTKPPAAGDGWSDEPLDEDDDETVIRPASHPAPRSGEAWGEAGSDPLGDETDQDAATSSDAEDQEGGPYAVVRSTTGLERDLMGTLVVGRRPISPQGGTDHGTADVLRLDASHLSAEHVELRGDPQGVYARDLGSTNGTTLRAADGTVRTLPKDPQRLHSGDVLDLGLGVRLILDGIGD